ncbi:hypothetical protein [Mobiluncus mulieris]|uniref:hypothetical protein n=1 Tax=Mobiluncus mulieris TaxID=2052 RepID=UPI00242ED159|nr:hypothetical protein [Mobiluncus mulieris]
MSNTETTDADITDKTDKTEETTGMPSENTGADSKESSQVKPGSEPAEPAEPAEPSEPTEAEPNKESNGKSNHKPADKPGKEPEALTSQQMIAQLNAEDYKGSELMDVLAEIEALISQARSLPMSSFVLVNKAQALSLLDSAREAMPADIRMANQIVAGANAVIERAQEEANEILAKAQSKSEQIQADAHARADELINKERIVVMAQDRAEQVIEKATKIAENQTSGADKYCEDKLAELEGILRKMQEQSAAGRKVLKERAKFDPETASEMKETHD